METRLRKIGAMTVEEPILDEEGQEKQRAYNEAVLMEYTEKRSLTSAEMCETTEKYEEDIVKHVIG